MDSLSKQFKSLTFAQFFKLKPRRKSGAKSSKFTSSEPQATATSASSSSSTLLACSDKGAQPIPIPSSTATTEQTATMSAEQFAIAVGMEVESFSDFNPELSILSIIASGSNDNFVTPVTSIRSVSLTSPSSPGMSCSFPKLDMNIFIPPPGFQQPSLQQQQQMHVHGHSLPLPKQKRRGSEPCYLNSNILHHRSSSTPDFKDIDEAATTAIETTGKEDDDNVQIRKKGRFTMKVERSAHWTASKGHRRRTSSRFSLQSATSSTLAAAAPQDVAMMGDLELTRQDTFESVYSVASSTLDSLDSTLERGFLASSSSSSLSNSNSTNINPNTADSNKLKETGALAADHDRRDSGVETV